MSINHLAESREGEERDEQAYTEIKSVSMEPEIKLRVYQLIFGCNSVSFCGSSVNSVSDGSLC